MFHFGPFSAFRRTLFALKPDKTAPRNSPRSDAARQNTTRRSIQLKTSFSGEIMKKTNLFVSLAALSISVSALADVQPQFLRCAKSAVRAAVALRQINDPIKPKDVSVWIAEEKVKKGPYARGDSDQFVVRFDIHVTDESNSMWDSYVVTAETYGEKKDANPAQMICDVKVVI